MNERKNKFRNFFCVHDGRADGTDDIQYVSPSGTKDLTIKTRILNVWGEPKTEN